MTESTGELVLTDVTRTYEGGNEVLRGICMAVPPGETVSIVGPSGCGKSTLLNIIGSLDRPSSGTVRMGETEISLLSGERLARFRSQQVGFVFQDHHLLPQLTAVENVLLPSIPARLPDSDARALGLLERVGIGDRAGSFPARMSGGERQRVAIARALVNGPRLLLCDEPTGNVDPENGRNLVSLFLELAAESGVTVVMVTHNLDFAGRFSRCMELRDGQLHHVRGRLSGTEEA